MTSNLACFLLFFFNDTATTEIYTLSLHDALPICRIQSTGMCAVPCHLEAALESRRPRSEEHTSELQSHSDLVCRLLLDKKEQRHGHHLAAGAAPRPPLPPLRTPAP